MRSVRLAEGDGDADSCSKLAVTGKVFRIERAFEKFHVQLFEPMRKLDGLSHRVVPVRIYHQLEVRAQRLAQRAHYPDVLVHSVAYLELYGLEALLFPAQRKRDLFIKPRYRKAGYIGRYLRAVCSAQELIHRHAEMLSRDVPQGTVHRRYSVHHEAAVIAAVAHEPVEHVPYDAAVEWVAPEQYGREQIMRPATSGSTGARASPQPLMPPLHVTLTSSVSIFLEYGHLYSGRR